MNRVWRVLLTAALLLLGGLFWIWILPYRYTAFLFWAAAVILLAVWGLRALEPRRPKLTRHLRRLGIVILAAALLYCGVLEGFILRDAGGAEDPRCDYVLVLGAGVNGTEPSRTLLARLETAYAYLETYPEARCVVSGGQGGGEDITEALCMYTWLVNRGVDPGRIWMEDKSTSTSENLRFTLNLIEAKTGSRPDTLAVISSEFHLCRAGCMAADLGVSMLGVPARTEPLPLRLHYYFREIFGMTYYFLLGA